MLTIQSHSYIYIATMLNHYEDLIKNAKNATELKIIHEKIDGFRNEITTQLN